MSERRPFSLAARLLSLLAVGLLVLQVGVFALTVHFRFEDQFRMAASDRARLAITLYQVLAALPPDQRADMVATLGFESFRLSLADAPSFTQSDTEQSLFFRRRLSQLYELSCPPPLPPLLTDVRAFRIHWQFWPSAPLPNGQVPQSGEFDASAALPFDDGTWLQIHYITLPLLDGKLFGLVVETAVQFLLQMLLAVASIRYVTRPLRRLARFADGVAPDGADGEPDDGLPDHGPREVVRTSAAFRAMRARIRRFVEERLRVLASLSHDLRTPLARLRLQLENEPALHRPELVFDALDDLERLTEDAITLARTGRNNEPERVTDLAALLESLVADREEYGEEADCLEQNAVCRVSLRASGPVLCRVRPAAFRRCLYNLVDNALRYGERAELSLDLVEREGKKLARVRVEDHGPGIPEDKFEDVFQLFYRLEDSRNARTGGTGLGLGIARDLARLNHSDITLTNRPGGGLTATLLVPLADEPQLA